MQRATLHACCSIFACLLLWGSVCAAPGGTTAASTCRLVLQGAGSSSSSSSGRAVKAAQLACRGSEVRVGVDTAHLGPFVDGFTGVTVDKAPCAKVAVPAAYDFLADEGLEAELTLQPLLCFSGRQRVVFEQLVVEGITMQFDTAASGSSTALLAFADDIAATMTGARIRGNQAGPTLLITGKAQVTLTAGSEMSRNQGITGAAAAVWDAASLTIINSMLAGNSATLRGGGVYAVDKARLVVQDSLLLQNRAGRHGAAIYLYDYVAVNITSTNCTKQAAAGYGACLEAGGNAVINIQGGVWSENTAVWGPCFDLLENTVLTTDSSFACINNTARGGSGGAGSMSGSSKATLIGGSRFEGNTADSGGAFYLEGDAGITIEDGTRIVNNTAAVSSGGGLWLKGSATADITDSDCTGNQAVQGGCMSIWEGAVMTFTGSVCSLNTANQGGCAFLQGSSSSLTLENSTVASNQAVSGAGVQVNDWGQLTLTGTDVENNTATVAGGGLYMSDYGFLDLGTGVSIRNNSAARYGGGAVLVSKNVSSLETLQKVVGTSNMAPYDSDISVLTTNLTLLSPAKVDNFVSRLGSDHGVLWVKLLVSGWFGLPVQGMLVQAVLPASNNEIIGVNRSAAGGSVQLGIKLRRPPGCHNITLALVEKVDLEVLGVNVPPVAVTVCVRQCLPGEVSTGDACETCRPGTYSFSPEGSDMCSACPSNGAVCPGGDVVLPEQGWWHSAPNSVQLHSCRNEAACSGNRTLVLLAGAAAPCSESQEAATTPPASAEAISLRSRRCMLEADQAMYKTLQCSEGYQGNLCGSCKAGWGFTQPFMCLRCLPKAGIVALYVVAAVAMLAVIKLQVHWLLVERHSAHYLQDGLQPTAMVKPLVLYCQYMLMVFSLHTAWPASLSYTLQRPLAWLWSSTSSQALSVECVLPQATRTPVAVLRLLFYLLMPAAMILALFFIEAATLAVVRARNKVASLHNVALTHRLASIAFVVVFFYLPSIVRTILSLFACIPLDLPVSEPYVADAVGSYWLYDMGQECHTGYHKAWSLGLGLPLLLLFFVVLPGGILLLLLRNRDLLNHPTFQSNYGYLYRLYKPRFCWFEAVWVCFTILLGVISVFGHVLGAYLQGCLMLLALAGMWLLLMLAKPYNHPVAGNMMLLAIGCLLITVYGGLLFLPNRIGSLPSFFHSSSTSHLLTSAGAEVVGAVLLLLNVLYVLLVLVNLVRVVRWGDLYQSLSATLSNHLSLKRSLPQLLTKHGRTESARCSSSLPVPKHRESRSGTCDPCEEAGGLSSASRLNEEATSRSSSDNSHARLMDSAFGLGAVAHYTSVSPLDVASASTGNGGCSTRSGRMRQRNDSSNGDGSSGSSGGGSYWVGRLIAETPVQQYRTAVGRQHRSPPMEVVPDSQHSCRSLQDGLQPPSAGLFGRLFGQRSSEHAGAVRVLHPGRPAASARAAALPSRAVPSIPAPPAAAAVTAAAAAAAGSADLLPDRVDAAASMSSSGGSGSLLCGGDDLPAAAGSQQPGSLSFSVPASNDLDCEFIREDSVPTPVPLSSIGTPSGSHRTGTAAGTGASSTTMASLGPETTTSSQPQGVVSATLNGNSSDRRHISASSLFSSPFHRGPQLPPAAAGVVAGNAGSRAGGRGDSNESLPSPFFN